MSKTVSVRNRTDQTKPVNALVEICPRKECGLLAALRGIMQEIGTKSHRYAIKYVLIRCAPALLETMKQARKAAA